MTRRNNTCDHCIRKKRKCDRGRPFCSNCISSNLDCKYSDTRPNHSHAQSAAGNGDLKALEQRLYQLENMISSTTDNGVFDSFKSVSSQMLNTTRPLVLPPQLISFSHQDPAYNSLFNSERDDLLTLAFRLLDCQFLFLKLDKVIAGCSESPLIKYAIYALGSTIALPSQVPDGVGSRKVMATIYYEKAISYSPHALSNCHETSILALIILSMTGIKMLRTREGIAHHVAAVRMALELGINTESKIAALTSVENEKDNLRRLWWCLYLMDRFLLEKNTNVIENRMNGVYLPNDEIEKSMDNWSEIGLNLMGSDEWFTPGLPNQTLDSYRILLWRTGGNALKFNHLAKNSEATFSSISLLYVMASLESSLSEWRRSLPDYVTSHISLVQTADTPITNPDYTWRVIYTVIQSNYTKALIHHPSLVKNVIESSQKAYYSHAFLETMNACHENAMLLSCFLRRNPSFEFCTSTISSFIFYTAFPLILAFQSDLPQNEFAKISNSLEIHLSALKEHAKYFEIHPVYLETIDYLLMLNDPMTCIKEFARLEAVDRSLPAIAAPCHAFLETPATSRSSPSLRHRNSDASLGSATLGGGDNSTSASIGIHQLQAAAVATSAMLAPGDMQQQQQHMWTNNASVQPVDANSVIQSFIGTSNQDQFNFTSY